MIYAVDFDGTLCEDKYPEIGDPRLDIIENLKEKRDHGEKLILWTCRVDERLAEAVKWCAGYGLFFDAVNENIPENVSEYGNDCRKVYADYYIDDRALLIVDGKLKYPVFVNI